VVAGITGDLDGRVSKASLDSSNHGGFFSLGGSRAGCGLSSEPGLDGNVSSFHESVGNTTVMGGLFLEVTPFLSGVEGVLEVDTLGDDGLLVLGDDGDGDACEGKCESHVKLCGSL